MVAGRFLQAAMPILDLYPIETLLVQLNLLRECAVKSRHLFP
jgi:hypothetical protein